MVEPYHASLARAVTDDRLREAAAVRERATWTGQSSLPHRLRHALTAWLDRRRSTALARERDPSFVDDGSPSKRVIRHAGRVIN